MVVYVSTSCHTKKKELFKVLDDYCKYNIKNVEIGSFHNYIENLDKLKSYDFKYLIHNYFPPSKKPLILNLASQNKEVLNNSIEHIKRSIKLCCQLEVPFYTFHPPYLQDPNLNFVFDYDKTINDYEECYNTFVDSLKIINAYAVNYNVKLVLENNISHTTNFGDVTDFVMFTKKEEFIRLFNEINSDNLKLLLDLGHLNVNAYWLKFDKFEFVNGLKSYIYAFHIHDNDGKIDSHSIIKKQSWILDFLDNELFNDLPKIIECQDLNMSDIVKTLKLIESI